MKTIFLLTSLCTLISTGFILALGNWWQLKPKQIRNLVAGVSFISSLLSLVLVYIFNIKHAVEIVCLCSALVGTATVGVILSCFYRDPERTPRVQENVILAPADGEVIYIKKIEKGEIPVSEKKSIRMKLNELTKTELLAEGAYLIGIGMNVLNVHVNRAPVPGKIRLIQHFPGKFYSLRNTAALAENERMTTVIENGPLTIGVIQIASRLVRRIVTYVQEAATVEIGQRFGMIKFGSQVDVVIPNHETIKISVRLKDEVRAGISILATYRIIEKSGENSIQKIKS